MEKRGQLVSRAIFAVIASAIIVVSFRSVGEAYGTEEAYYKLAVAKDLALTIDLLYSLPGDVEYIYPNDVSGYDIELKDNKVSVFKHDSNKLDPSIGIYEFVGISSDKPNFIVKNEKFVKIRKIGNNVAIIR